jgi:hypothetical protein
VLIVVALGLVVLGVAGFVLMHRPERARSLERRVVERKAQALGLVLLAFVSAGALAGLALHDYGCHTEGLSAVCGRPDGSTWQDPYAGCLPQSDPRCASPEEACPRSRELEPAGRPSCQWIFFRS